MAKARRRRLLTLLLVVAVLTAGLLGTVDATKQVENQELTTGHSTFTDASTTFNSCFAGLAGLLLQRVTWFNGQTLFTRADSGGDKWVYVTENFVDEVGDNGDPDGFDDETQIRINDPSDETLYRTNKTYKFSDKNQPSKDWIVYEYFALRDQKDDQNSVSGGGEEIHLQKKKVYVFVVEVADGAIEDKTIEKDYNFAMVIDTCRFKNAQTGEVEHNNTEEGTTGAPSGQHDNDTANEGDHNHSTYAVDIWVGDKPSALGGDEPGIPQSRQADGGEDS